MGKCISKVELLPCRVTLLDHHKTAFEEMEGKTDPPKNLEVNLDMHLSGATIALKYFKPKVQQPYQHILSNPVLL